MLRFNFRHFASILLLSLVLSGCGIRPATVDAPPGAENRTFPRTYPDTTTLKPVPPATPTPPVVFDPSANPNN